MDNGVDQYLENYSEKYTVGILKMLTKQLLRISP